MSLASVCVTIGAIPLKPKLSVIQMCKNSAAKLKVHHRWENYSFHLFLL